MQGDDLLEKLRALQDWWSRVKETIAGWSKEYWWLLALAIFGLIVSFVLMMVELFLYAKIVEALSGPDQTKEESETTFQVALYMMVFLAFIVVAVMKLIWFTP